MFGSVEYVDLIAQPNGIKADDTIYWGKTLKLPVVKQAEENSKNTIMSSEPLATIEREVTTNPLFKAAADTIINYILFQYKMKRIWDEHNEKIQYREIVDWGSWWVRLYEKGGGTYQDRGYSSREEWCFVEGLSHGRKWL